MRDNIELDRKEDGERSGEVTEKELNDQHILYEILKEYKICLNRTFKERFLYFQCNIVEDWNHNILY